MANPSPLASLSATDIDADESATSTAKPRKTYIVTGGSGFIGSHLVERLLCDGHTVLVLDNKYPCNDILCQIEQAKANGSKFILCDIRRYNDVYRALSLAAAGPAASSSSERSRANSGEGRDGSEAECMAVPEVASGSRSGSGSDCGIECVFHCAALTDAWAPPSLYEAVNVTGTTNLIRACQEHGVARLVFTSSSSVVLDGSDCQNGDESMKYVAKPLNAYSASKQRAEQAVLAANGERGLLTAALRPHCVFGPRDTHLVAQLVLKAQKGKITHMIGEGHNIADFTFIDNVVHAHLLCADALRLNGHAKSTAPAAAVAAGQVYFVTNGEPTLFWSFLGALLQQLGCPRPTKHISYNVAYALAVLMELLYMMIGWLLGWRPIITRQMVATMALHHWFSHAKATSELGYRPIVTLETGIKRTVLHMQSEKRRRRASRDRDAFAEGYAGLSGSDSSASLRSLNRLKDEMMTTPID